MRAFGAFATLLLTCLSGPGYANGALAIDTNQGSHYGFSYGYASQHDADRRAVQECGAHRCHVVVQFRHACAAYAADQASGSTAYGWGTQSPGNAGGSSEQRAKSRAVSECASRGGSNSDCIIRVWGCDP
jgi:Domain of unknown function (DUF4189)